MFGNGLKRFDASDVSLGDISRFIRGITFKPEDVTSYHQADALMCMRTKNVQAILDMTDVWGIPNRFVKRSDQILRPGDILVSSANSWNLVGKCCWIPELAHQATFGGFVTVLRANLDRVDSRFLYHWFSSDEVQEEVRSFGRKTTNISNLDLGRCLDLPVSLPSLPNQRLIAAILDEADALRTKYRSISVKLDEIAVSIFHETFCKKSFEAAYEQVSIGSLAKSMRTGPFGSQLLHSEFVEEGVAVLGIDNAVSNRFSWKERRYVTHQKYEQLVRYRVYPGDVVITIMGTCGRAAIIPIDIPAAITTKHLCSITLDTERCLPEYLHACLLTHPAVLHQLGATAKGAVMPGLNMGLIKSTIIPLPPIAIQKRFATRLEAFASLRETLNASSAKAASLFASLQRRAFRGEF